MDAKVEERFTPSGAAVPAPVLDAQTRFKLSPMNRAAYKHSRRINAAITVF
jgi:hypothetical protein